MYLESSIKEDAQLSFEKDSSMLPAYDDYLV